MFGWNESTYSSCHLIAFVLSLILCLPPIKAWADAFRSSPDLTGVVSVYEDLRRKGLEFPVTELDGYSSVQAPKKVQAVLGADCFAAYYPGVASPLWSLLFLAISVLLPVRLWLEMGLLLPLCLLCAYLPNLRSSHLRPLSSNWPLREPMP